MVAAFPPSQPALHLLLVEDTPEDAELVVLTLQEAQISFTYTVVSCPQECQACLQNHRYNAVLSDYRLPGFTAYQVLEWLQASGQEIPLILITGTLGEEAAVACIKAGMTDYVLKERLFRLPMALQRSLQEFALRRQQRENTARLQQQAQREATINRMIQAMRETLVLSEMMQTVADLLHDALAVSRCVVFTLASPTQELSCHCYVSQATADRQAFLSGQRHGDPGQQWSLISNPLRSQAKPVVLTPTTASSSEPIDRVLRAWSVQSMLVVPLIYQQTVLGEITLHQCDRPREWTADDIDLVQTVADQGAIAIHQANLFQQVQQQARREQVLNQISHTLNSSLDPEHILEKMVQLTGECFEVDRVILFSLDEDFRTLNEWRVNESVASLRDLQVPMAEWSKMLDPNSPFWCEGVFHAPNYPALLPTAPATQAFLQAGTRSVLRVPIFVHGKLFGGLSLQMVHTFRTFTSEEIDLLRRLADEMAIALYNARSYEQLEQLVRDRTKELEQEKWLSDAANRAKSEFLTHMSHELRTPLTGILGFTSLLSKQIFGPLNDKQLQYVNGIASCGQHLLDLINDLLDLSKIEAGKEDLVLEPISLQDLCESCISLIDEIAQARGLKTSWSLATQIETFTADKRRLKQILFNLLANAVKFTEEGSVRLHVHQQGEFLHFDVIDTGIGIAPEDIGKLFQSFQQLDGGLDRKYEGTGLGLTLARKLAQLHGGDITVTSELGQGSCFSCILPIRPIGLDTASPPS
ncbi:MAG TPA: GAF domain-containing protein [Synechococcales cyanobacterium M55_K2018_004]|nr:GAF domain-containing protein [Synechococcales cyanobacterium M55_K2018_004]